MSAVRWVPYGQLWQVIGPNRVSAGCWAVEAMAREAFARLGGTLLTLREDRGAGRHYGFVRRVVLAEEQAAS